jgi:hypothetical protein
MAGEAPSARPARAINVDFIFIHASRAGLWLRGAEVLDAPRSFMVTTWLPGR